MIWLAALKQALSAAGVLLGAVVATPIGAAAVTIAAGVAWNAWIDNPRVRREATDGLVAKVELDAVNATLERERALREAAERALAGYTKAAAEDAAADAEHRERLEQEIADNEKLLAAAGRACALDDADVEWLRNAGRKAPRGGG